MAARDDSAVKREEFLAALKTLEPVPPAEEDAPSGGAVPAEGRTTGDDEEARASIMAEIAEGVQAEADKGDGGKGKAKGNGEAGAVATLGAGAVELGLDGPTFEDLVRDVLAEELRRWVEDNLEAVTERVVREEIQMMGRRRRPPES